MTTGFDDFERSCRDTARQLRRMPVELRATIDAEGTDRIAEPVAAAIRSAQSGPWAAPIAAATKAVQAADPTIAIGGTRPVVSGGASVNQLAPGSEWGGGRRRTRVTRRTRNGGRSTTYTLASTRQFTQAHPAIIPTLHRQSEQILDAWETLTLDVFDQVVPSG